MKKRTVSLTAWLLLLALVLSSCSAEPPASLNAETGAGETLPVSETLPPKGTYRVELDEEAEAAAQNAEEKMTQKLTLAQLAEIPLAQSSMTPDELREICLRYFLLQISFQWTPSRDILDYPDTHYEFDTPRTLDLGSVYGGIPYQSMGTGNLYRWMEYYDEEKGVFDFGTAFAENGGEHKTDIELDAAGNQIYYKWRSMMIFFNQCSVASFWGWARVINSANFSWTADMNVRNGFIPVGGYTYGYEYEGKYYGAETIDRFGKLTENNPAKYDTDDVIFSMKVQYGSTGVYPFYAQMKPADCLVSGGHAMMVERVEMVYREDGVTPDYRNCRVVVLEQIEGWGESRELDGVPYRIQGGIHREYTFARLAESNYIPFTFAEFLEEGDPLLEGYEPRISKAAYVNCPEAKSDVSAAVDVGKVYCTESVGEGKSLPVERWKKMVVASNYPISDVFVTVTDPETGEVLLKNVHRAMSAHLREVPMTARHSSWDARRTISDRIEEFADGSKIVEVSLQISTGERLTAFRGTLCR